MRWEGRCSFLPQGYKQFFNVGGIVAENIFQVLKEGSEEDGLLLDFHAQFGRKMYGERRCVCVNREFPIQSRVRLISSRRDLRMDESQGIVLDLILRSSWISIMTWFFFYGKPRCLLMFSWRKEKCWCWLELTAQPCRRHHVEFENYVFMRSVQGVHNDLYSLD